MEQQVNDIFSQKRVRNGKTARERANGTFRNRFTNRQARASWQNENRGTKGSSPFPAFTCHGKGNSSKARKWADGQVVN